jgi:DNA-binding beta-propeller fold protein YncE
MGDAMKVLTASLVFGAAVLSAQTITTIAGTGTAGFSGDGGPGVAAQINNPYGLTIGPDGALYFCEIGNHRIRRLDLKSGVISTAAGSGKKGYAGDGGPALAAEMNEPYEVRFDKAGNMFLVEMQNHVVRRVDGKTHVITTVAGTGAPGFGGDGGSASAAQFRQPHSIAFDAQGRLLICDIGNQRVRRIDLASGRIETWLGGGEPPLKGPRAIFVTGLGYSFLALREGNAVYRVDNQNGSLTHVAGTGVSGYTGDGGPAKEAKLSGPKGVAYSRDAVFIADTESHTVRRIDLKDGTIRTVVGTGQRGDGPDGDPLKCRLARPHGVFVADDGTVFIGDSENHRIRMVK